MFHFTKKRAVVIAVVGSLALGAGAYAYFTSTGTGSSGATVGTSTPWLFSDVSTTGGPLTPGGITQTLTYKVKNNSSGQQSLAGITVKVANNDGTPWIAVADCSASDFSIGNAAAGFSYVDTQHAGNIPPGTEYQESITIKMVDTGANQNACQGKTPPLHLTAS